jgi:signal transduction histidine kinase
MNRVNNQPPRGSEGPSATLSHERQEHSVQFYGEDSGLIESVSGYIGEVLEENNVALVVAIPAHREMLKRRLEERGIDMQRTIAESRYVEADAQETLSSFLVEGWPDAARYKQTIATFLTQLRGAAKGDPPRLAILGEMVGLLWSQGRLEAAVRLEQLWNELQATESFSLRCVYPMQRLEHAQRAQGFLAICAEHTHVIPGESFTELRELAARQLTGQDEERRRIAQALRESTGRDLAMLGTSLADLQDEARLLNPGLAKGLETNRENVHKMSQDLREFANSLHPPMLDELGLGAALRWYAREVEQHGKVRVEIDVAVDFGRVRSDLEIALFRIVQEILANVERHSGGTKAVVELARNADRIRLSVIDEGTGMTSDKLAAMAVPAESKLGLRAVRERAKSCGGELQILSGTNGTEVRVIVRQAP